MNINAVTKCRECGSTDLSWDVHSKTDSGVPEGRLRSSEVKCLFVLGCVSCSETLAVISADKVAAMLNADRASATAESAAP